MNMINYAQFGPRLNHARLRADKKRSLTILRLTTWSYNARESSHFIYIELLNIHTDEAYFLQRTFRKFEIFANSKLFYISMHKYKNHIILTSPTSLFAIILDMLKTSCIQSKQTWYDCA